MRIGIDFDGTIADTNKEKSDWIRNKLNQNIPSYLCDRTSAIDIIGESQYKSMKREICSIEKTLELHPIDGFIDAFNTISEVYDICVITARYGKSLDYIEAWFDQYQLSKIQVIGMNAKNTSKIKICKLNDIRILIDDDFRHLSNCLERDVCGILFKPGAPNSYKCGNCIVCRSWSEIKELLIKPTLS